MKDDTRSKVSVITPSYNQRRFLEANLRSVSNQSYYNLQHLVVDGGSDDQTVDLLREWEDRHEHDFDWISEADQGQGDAVNKGFDAAEGEIVGWLNSDDLYPYEDTITTVVDAFDENQEADVLYGDALEVDVQGRITQYKRVREFSRDALTRGCFLVQPAVFLRSSICKSEKLRLDLEFALDYEYWLRVSVGNTFHRIDAPLAADRMHPDRKTMKGSDRMKAQSEQIRRDYGYEGTDRYGQSRWLDHLFSGIPRRLTGGLELFRLSQRRNLLSNSLQWDGTLSILLRHLTPFPRTDWL